MSTSNRVVIVAEGAQRAEAIRQGLRHAAGCRVLGYVDVRQLAAGPLREAAPDLVVLDEARPRAAHTAQKLRGMLPDAKLVLLASQMDAERRSQAATAGVDAIISKDCGPSTVGVLVGEIAAGNVFHSFQPAERAASPSLGHLSARERELLKLVAAGADNAVIAAHLWVTEQTVKLELTHLYRKLGVPGPAEAGLYARTNGLVDADQDADNVARLAAVA
jgi:DNA-binding NarL/FixJ family response regulator